MSYTACSVLEGFIQGIFSLFMGFLHWISDERPNSERWCNHSFWQLLVAHVHADDGAPLTNAKLAARWTGVAFLPLVAALIIIGLVVIVASFLL